MEFNEVEELFRVPADEGIDKRVSLEDSIRNNLKPGNLVHLGAAANLPYGFSYEITRQFWGKNAEFTMSCVGASSNILIPLSSSFFNGGNRIVKKIITTYAGDIYPSPAPSKIMSIAYANGLVEIENYSLLSLVMRYFAGAMNMPFIPIKSIIGSDISSENADAVKFLKNPFLTRSNDDDVCLLAPLNPDVAFMHGIWADKHGNTLLIPPYTGYMWGVLASKKIIVSVEKIVPTEVIRKYNYLMKIPGHRVDAVVELPYGAHPSANRGMPPDGYGYAEDYDFIVDWRKASRPDRNIKLDLNEPQSINGAFKNLKGWLDKWILSGSYDDYIKQLGTERLDFLKMKAEPDYWKKQINQLLNSNKINSDGIGIDFSKHISKFEAMAITMASIGLQKIQSNKYTTILAGQGVSNLAAWLCRKKMGNPYGSVNSNGSENSGHIAELMAEVGFYGYHPRPGSPFIFNFANFLDSKGLMGIFDTLGYCIQGFQSKNIGFLGAGQIDKRGNINSTKAGSMYIVGSGGAADVCGCSKEVLVCAEQSALRLVDKVPYITGIGKNVSTLVTDMGVFEKPNMKADNENTGNEFILTKIFSNLIPEQQNETKVPKIMERDDKRLKKALRKIKRETGWTLLIADKLEIIDVNSPEFQRDAKILRLFDVNGNFL